ncbi:MAG: DUF1501 domain-containing protein [Saprospiraceae bacterium]|nr:DUF1501 domain-containing protein [Saprospiraceae bacterium]
MDRRHFLNRSAILSASSFLPTFVKRSEFDGLEVSRTGNVLVVIQLSGGNDGLNAIVPYQDDVYYQNRPTIGIRPEHLLKMSDMMGLHPAMAPLREIYDSGEMTVVNGVGYPNPNRSHFRSMDIWHSAGDGHRNEQTGWIGRYLDSNCNQCAVPYHALEIGDELSLALKGHQRDGFAMRNPNKLKKTATNPFHVYLAKNYLDRDLGNNVDYLYKTMIEVQESATYLYQQSKKKTSRTSYPRHPFAIGLKQIAELIMAGTDTKIYYISLSGFDTHVNQGVRQSFLLKNYSEAVSAFIKDLKANNLLDDTLVMTFSEFGRRVKENGSRGTDHGTANNVFFFGGRLTKPGMYNSMTDLTQLDQGDLKHQVDFRSLYASLLEDWLGSSASTILPGAFEKLSIV